MFSRLQPVKKFKHDVYSGLRIFSFVFSYPLFNDFFAYIIQSTENATLHYGQYVKNRESSDFSVTLYSME
jgi:hypothetical protein